MKLFWPRQSSDDQKMAFSGTQSKVSLMKNCTMLSTPQSPQSATGGYSDQIIEVNFRYTALIACCLGFLFIWSTMVSSFFIVRKLDENHLLHQPLERFYEQEKIGRIMFFVGQEMLSTVDSLVSIQLNISSSEELSQSLNLTWSLTDNQIADVRTEIDTSSDLVYLLAAIESKLALIRCNLSLETEHPLNMIKSYKLIFDLTEQTPIDRQMLMTGRLHDSHSRLLLAFIEIQNAPYRMFIKGMNRRFIELSYGTIYHLGPELFNYTDVDTEISNYFYYFHSSHELIEEAFAWDPRIYHHFIELLKANRGQMFQDKSIMYRHNGREYIRFVNDAVTFLLHAKDVLNTSLDQVLLQFSSKNDSLFFPMIALIYLSVLSACTVFFVLFVRNANIKTEPVRKLPPITTISGSYIVL